MHVSRHTPELRATHHAEHAPILPRLRSIAEGVCALPLAFVLLTYGLGKVVHRQFVLVGSETLDARAHELSGFDLVWVMHAFSRRYEFALGLAECFVGLLLLHPRSRLIGALASAGIMANLTLLNIEYAIPALPVAASMLVLSVILLALRWRQVVGVFWLSRPIQPPADPRWSVATISSARGVALFTLILPIASIIRYDARYHASYPAPLAGRYVIDTLDPPDADLAPPGAASAAGVGSFLYFEFAGRGGLRTGERRAHAEHTQEGGVLRFDAWEFTDAMTDDRARSLILRGKIAGPDDAGAFTIHCTQPAGVRVRLRPDPLDWPAKHRR
jgi:hypothetical protein